MRSGEDEPWDPNDALAEATAAFWGGDEDRARQITDALLADHPDHVGLLLFKGSMLLRSDRVDEAGAILDRAMELASSSGSPLLARVYAERAIALDRAGRWLEGSALMAKSLALMENELAQVPPSNARARRVLGADVSRRFIDLAASLMRQERDAEAGVALKRSLAVAADVGASTARSHLWLGRHAMHLNDTAAAVAHFRAGLDFEWRATRGVQMKLRTRGLVHRRDYSDLTRKLLDSAQGVALEEASAWAARFKAIARVPRNAE